MLQRYTQAQLICISRNNHLFDHLLKPAYSNVIEMIQLMALNNKEGLHFKERFFKKIILKLGVAVVAFKNIWNEADLK